MIDERLSTDAAARHFATLVHDSKTFILPYPIIPGIFSVCVIIIHRLSHYGVSTSEDARGNYSTSAV